MRLTQQQRDAIIKAVRKVYGDHARVILFGSRVDDQRRGGDIDLLVQPDPSHGNGGIKQKLQLHGELERELGERKIDVIIEAPGDTRPVVQVAREQGVAL